MAKQIMRPIARSGTGLAALVFTLAGCGGGGDLVDAGSNLPPVPPPADELSWDNGNWDETEWQ